MTALLVASQLSYSINKKRLVDQVSFTLEPSEVLILVGPNGAGKTTLLRLLAGDLLPESGEVLVGGINIQQIRARDLAQQRAVLRQGSFCTFPFTVIQVVLMGRHPHLDRGGETITDLEVSRQALERTEMHTFVERIFPTLSGGEQTRVNLARVLAQTTPMLLLDEPTAALDLRHQHATMQIAREIATAGGAVLAIVHDLNLAAAYADRIGILHAGRLVALGTPGDVFQDDLLADVYNVPIRVEAHPFLPLPLVLVTPTANRVPA